MDPARWDRVQALFHNALDLPEPQRSGFLNVACAEDPAMLAQLVAMLEEDGRASLLDRDVTEVASTVFGDTLSASFKEFSPYRIKNVLGEGGMGVVYLAERKDLGNLVAIKILRDAWLSPARRERFAAEQRTLAQLNHPSIARLYDANTLPDGTPWFVMEYVDGLPLTDFCARNQCSTDDRLKLIRSVAEAVQYAHDHGIIHRDLKPSNILVKADGSVRLLDFGIAKQLDPAGRPVNHTRTAFRPMTPAYASPEQLRGDSVSVHTDVYSLGVILYELLTGKLPFDISNKTASEAEAIITTGEPPKPSTADTLTRTRVSKASLDALCLTAMNKDPQRRYPSITAFIRDIDHYLNHEPLEARPRAGRFKLDGFARRNAKAMTVAAAVFALAIVAIVTLALSPKAAPSRSKPQSAAGTPATHTLAVLPLVNSGSDPSLDFLSQALADEISRTLGYARSLTLRPPGATRRLVSPTLDLQKVGRELHAATVVSGQFIKAGEQLQITLEVTDVDSNRLQWSDVFDAPAQSMMAMQAQVAAKTRRALAPVLGVSEFVTDNPPKPKNEEAYQLFLRAKSLTSEVSANPQTRDRAMEMLNRSLQIDPGYAPGWELLAGWYAADGWFGTGGQVALERWRTLADKIVVLDPDNVIFRADLLYIGSESGASPSGKTRGEAYRELRDLLRRRPDRARLHFILSWLLRDTGMLEESAQECETSVLIDAQDAGARSCGVTFMLRGDYARAFDYLHLDPDSEVSKAVSIDLLLRQGKQKEALQAMSEKLPQWSGYPMVQAYLQHRPADEIAEMARKIQPAPDPEVNYFSAAHLAYVGQTVPALEMLKRTVAGGYCSYPAVDSDPFLSSLHARPELKEIRAAAVQCQNTFLIQRKQ